MDEVTAKSEPVRVECDASDAFCSWLSQAGGSLAVSTYQAGKVAMIGWTGRQVNLLMREFEKPLGIAVQGQHMALATRNQVWFFSNAPALAHDYLEAEPGRYDAIFLPRVVFQTNDVNAHDLGFVGRDLRDLVIVNTRFSCLARLAWDHNFTPFWWPKFVSDIVPEDRCHLNGMAVCDGKPRWVTALGTTDKAGTWRENKATGGVLIDVESGEFVLQGLSMPHSPRWYGGRLWVLNSGAGELLLVDPAAGRSTVVCRFPGYLRGLCFAGPYAVVGLSKIREKHIFGGLPIQERCPKLQCGLMVVDLRNGVNQGMFEFTAGCEELYDVQFLPGIFRPTILNLERDVVREAITYPGSSFWLRPSKEVQEEALPAADAGSEAALIGSGPGEALNTTALNVPNSGT